MAESSSQRNERRGMKKVRLNTTIKIAKVLVLDREPAHPGQRRRNREI